MKIETKFNNGDKLFYIFNSKVLESTVRGFKIENLKDETTITYLCNDEEDQRIHIKVLAEHAFHSKKELLASL